MSVFNRKLFNNELYQSKGTGITTGLDTEDNRLNELFEQQQKILQGMRPPTQEVSKFEAASPALIALGAGLMSGRSFQGGFGGALDILGQATAGALPLANEALATRRKAKADERAEQFQLDLQAYGSATDMLAAEKLADAKKLEDVAVFKHKGTFNEVFTYPTDPQADGYVEEKAGQKVNRIVSISAKETPTGTQYGDEIILSEEPYIDETPPTGTAKNILFKTGSKANETSAAIVYNDGRTMYYDPTNSDADENGLVNVAGYDGEFELYTSQTTDKKSDFLTSNDISKITNNIATFSETMAKGGNLLMQGQNLGENLSTLNRFILDTGGNILGQFSPSAKQALFDWFDQNPDELTKFVADARAYAAQMIAPFTGEDSSRVSEPEREITNQALRLFNGIVDAETALAAIEASIALSYVSQHRNFLTIPDGNYQYAVNDPEENYNGWGLNKEATEYHAAKLRKLGLSENVIKDVILQMQSMETLGLEELKAITDGFNSRSTDSINKQQDVLLG
jgi:hypothetical protein